MPETVITSTAPCQYLRLITEHSAGIVGIWCVVSDLVWRERRDVLCLDHKGRLEAYQDHKEHQARKHSVQWSFLIQRKKGSQMKSQRKGAEPQIDALRAVAATSRNELAQQHGGILYCISVPRRKATRKPHWLAQFKFIGPTIRGHEIDESRPRKCGVE